MADPRFYENRGPFTLADICAKASIAVPDCGTAQVFDLASLDGAAAQHLSFFSGTRQAAEAFTRSSARFCLVPNGEISQAPPSMTLLPCASVDHAFAAIASLFYPTASLAMGPQEQPIDPGAILGEGAILEPGVVIGPGAEIGNGTRIGAGSVIAPGVAIGQNCEIGSNVTISHAYIGDRVTILPGARIGQPGFGLASSQQDHAKIPQLGRVIIQDDVEIGSGTTIDRGALGDTVIGEGSKLDNLVQVGHNVHIGRHCVLVNQVKVAGSSVIEDFAMLGGRVGAADHVHAALVSGQNIPGGQR
jgi:UDP-3-O-[3-hydroxymyristoyl] glucosamine N-acyltransferase